MTETHEKIFGAALAVVLVGGARYFNVVKTKQESFAFTMALIGVAMLVGVGLKMYDTKKKAKENL